MEFGSNMPAWSLRGEGIGVVRQESRGMEVSRGFGVGIEAISWVEEGINLWSGNEVSGRMRGC